MSENLILICSSLIITTSLLSAEIWETGSLLILRPKVEKISCAKHQFGCFVNSWSSQIFHWLGKLKRGCIKSAKPAICNTRWFPLPFILTSFTNIIRRLTRNQTIICETWCCHHLWSVVILNRFCETGPWALDTFLVTLPIFKTRVITK